MGITVDRLQHYHYKCPILHKLTNIKYDYNKTQVVGCWIDYVLIWKTHSTSTSTSRLWGSYTSSFFFHVREKHSKNLFLDLEDALNLNRAIVRQGGEPHCTPSTHPLLGTKHLEEIFCWFLWILLRLVKTSIMRLEKPLMMVMHSEPLIVSGLALTIPNVFTILSTLHNWNV